MVDQWKGCPALKSSSSNFCYLESAGVTNTPTFRSGIKWTLAQFSCFLRLGRVRDVLKSANKWCDGDMRSKWIPCIRFCQEFSVIPTRGSWPPNRFEFCNMEKSRVPASSRHDRLSQLASRDYWTSLCPSHFYILERDAFGSSWSARNIGSFGYPIL